MDIGTSITGDGLGVRYPASLAQTRFWLLDALEPGTPALNVAVRWSLLGPVTPDAIEAALQRTVARHEVLRTALIDVDGTPMQLVRPSMTLVLAHHDLTALPVAAREAEADRLGEAEARVPFALENPPLLRATLITLAPDSARLLLTMHHAVCDGWSVGVVAAEMMAALRGDPPAPELPLQYGDYAEWQQAWLASPALDAAREYWMHQLRDLPYVSVPPDRAAERRGAGRIASALLPAAVSDAMVATASRHGCTPFAVALAALGRVLQARTGAADIPIGSQVAGRTETELEGMVGAFINTLVLRLDVSGDPDWDTRVSLAAAAVEGALTHHAMPFELLIRALNPPRQRRGSPLFSVNLIFQRSFVAPAEGGGVTLVDLPSHSAGALYDLNFFMVARPDGWRASCEYDAALFDATTVDAMLTQWRLALAGKPIMAGPPPDPVMQQLSAIWQEVLGVPACRATDGFFDLGGHSLLAARMLARVEAVFGSRIGMAELFADATLGGLAARLRPAPAGASSPVVVAVGTVAAWRGVSDTLGPGYAFTCVSDAAADMVRAMHPDGPVAVLGRGDGGSTALALARTLRREGRAVTLLLLDAAAPKRSALSRLRPGFGGFDGRAVLLQSGAAAEGWASWLRGPVDRVVLSASDPDPTMTEQVRRAFQQA